MTPQASKRKDLAELEARRAKRRFEKDEKARAVREKTTTAYQSLCKESK